MARQERLASLADAVIRDFGTLCFWSVPDPRGLAPLMRAKLAARTEARPSRSARCAVRSLGGDEHRRCNDLGHGPRMIEKAERIGFSLTQCASGNCWVIEGDDRPTRHRTAKQAVESLE